MSLGLRLEAIQFTGLSGWSKGANLNHWPHGSIKQRIGHIIRHNEFAVNILVGATSGKKVVGRPRLQYLK
jgi:hypothetical protein